MRKTLLIVLLLVSTQVRAQKNSSKSYIEKFKDNAISIMHATGIPASIILAIAMHESGNGNSAIATNLNNQFGMKGAGRITYKKRRKRISTFYKRYDSVLESFQDFARLMTERKKFCHLASDFSHYDYQGWVHGIQKAGYASSHKWGSQVLGLINKYQLNNFDEKPETDTQINIAMANQQQQ